MKEEIPYNTVPEIETIQAMLLQSAERYPDNIALQDIDNTPLPQFTYKSLLDSVLRFGTALKKLKIEERTHIAIIGENRAQWAAAYLTCMMFNHVAVPIDKNLTPNEIINIVFESEAEVIIFSDSFADMIFDHHFSMKRIKHYICMDKSKLDKKFHSMPEMISTTEPAGKEKLPEINPDDLAEIIFTSGALGRAKGVMLSQRNIAANLVDMVRMIMIYPDDRFLSILPIHHTYECTCGLLCPLFSGASVHFARGLKFVIEDFQKAKPTVFLGVPLLYDKMFRRISKAIKESKVKSVMVPGLVLLSNAAKKAGLKNLKKKLFKTIHERFGGAVRMFIVGGAAADPSVAKGLSEFGFTFLQGYGLTETSPILAVNRLEKHRDDSAGLPLPRVKLRIDNPDENGIGEIAAKGPNIMLGYYKNETITKQVLQDGWFKTGDLGRLDEQNFLYISGRKKNVIISKSGKNVFPEEIEDLLNRSPFILESVVYGYTDKKQDEIIAVDVVVDAETLITFVEDEHTTINDELIHKKVAEAVSEVNKQLPAYKHIKKFFIREEEFEKTTTQKIKRYLIQKRDSNGSDAN
jgi:long-chain acyl-CoA synthetase